MLLLAVALKPLVIVEIMLANHGVLTAAWPLSSRASPSHGFLPGDGRLGLRLQAARPIAAPGPDAVSQLRAGNFFVWGHAIVSTAVEEWWGRLYLFWGFRGKLAARRISAVQGHGQIRKKGWWDGRMDRQGERRNWSEEECVGAKVNGTKKFMHNSEKGLTAARRRHPCLRSQSS
jgi:hypothetical protein